MVVSQRLGHRVVHMPQLTQTLGVLLPPTNKQSHTARLSAEMEILRRMVEAIPEFGYFDLNFHYTFTNWLPFHWAGYSQTTRYTYVIPDLTDEESLWEGLRGNIRGAIRKARKSGLRVEANDDVHRFYEMNSKTFSRQGLPVPYTRSFFEGIDRACKSRGARRILWAVDDSGCFHASVYIVWDANSAYYLAGGADPEFRNSGATSLLLWESLRLSSKVTRRFDFEGSMNQSTERFFRAFGARQMPYFRITRDNRSLLARGGLALCKKAALKLRKVGLRR
jgi:lipid II:glycine glycyltransferase (peptidoglycan interpeptide bridge formation enzyme)